MGNQITFRPHFSWCLGRSNPWERTTRTDPIHCIQVLLHVRIHETAGFLEICRGSNLGRALCEALATEDAVFE